MPAQGTKSRSQMGNILARLKAKAGGNHLAIESSIIEVRVHLPEAQAWGRALWPGMPDIPYITIMRPPLSRLVRLLRVAIGLLLTC